MSGYEDAYEAAMEPTTSFNWEPPLFNRNNWRFWVGKAGTLETVNNGLKVISFDPPVEVSSGWYRVSISGGKAVISSDDPPSREIYCWRCHRELAAEFSYYCVDCGEECAVEYWGA